MNHMDKTKWTIFCVFFFILFVVVLPQHVNECKCGPQGRSERTTMDCFFKCAALLVQNGLPFWKQNKENFEFLKIITSEPHGIQVNAAKEKAVYSPETTSIDKQKIGITDWMPVLLQRLAAGRRTASPHRVAESTKRTYG